MTNKHYVSPAGSYLAPYGSFYDGCTKIPDDAVEVSGPPAHGRQFWDSVAESWYDTKEYLGDYLADYRWRKETGGIVFNALNILTRDRDKLLIKSASEKAEADNDGTIEKQFKIANGFVTLTNAQIIDMHDALIGHIDDCFAAEAATCQKILDDILTSVAAVEADFDTEYSS